MDTIAKKGFTLVELLVAVSVFAIVGGIASEILVSGLRAQRKSLAFQELLSETSYFIEYVSRAVRMAKKDIDGNCTGLATANYAKADSKIMFENYQGICQEFYLEGNQLKQKKGENVSDLTSANLTVSHFQIGPEDSWDQDDNLQPRVTLSFEVAGKEQSKIKIQTTISQRNFDVVK